MSRRLISRRQFLTLPVAALLNPTPVVGALAQPGTRRVAYTVEADLLHGLIRFRLDGTIVEAIDRATGHYDVKAYGEGDGIANRMESRGVLGEGRWRPLRAQVWSSVRGRESRADVAYDYTRHVIDYHFRGETFFLRRHRTADDVVHIPAGLHVDDAVSATLNYADGLWEPRSSGTLETWVVRRKSHEDEEPEGTQKLFGAELVPLRLKLVPGPASAKPAAEFDLTRFSSWAKREHPARVTFGRDRRPESMVLPMVLGTTVRINMRAA